MREIKYKYVYKNVKKASYLFDYFTIEDIENLTESYLAHKKLYYCLVDRLQYTRLKDKNGKEIYEGDIIKADDITFPILIEYSENYYQGNYCRKIVGFSVPDGVDINTGKPTLEIIGNIYENPELLRAKK